MSGDQAEICLLVSLQVHLPVQDHWPEIRKTHSQNNIPLYKHSEPYSGEKQIKDTYNAVVMDIVFYMVILLPLVVTETTTLPLTLRTDDAFRSLKNSRLNWIGMLSSLL